LSALGWPANLKRTFPSTSNGTNCSPSDTLLISYKNKTVGCRLPLYCERNTIHTLGGAAVWERSLSIIRRCVRG
jgi:hypothetical protein